MSAETLREAARLMRERAEAAMASLPDAVPDWHSVAALMGGGKTEGDAAHIASRHPAVALAVAGLFDHHAKVPSSISGPLLAVARAYLGSDA